MSNERSAHVDTPVAGLYATSNTWPGLPGVLEPNPL